MVLPHCSSYRDDCMERVQSRIECRSQHSLGEALYRFLLSQSATRPEYTIHARGTRTEHKSRTVTSTDSNGNTTSRSESYTETVTGE